MEESYKPPPLEEPSSSTSGRTQLLRLRKNPAPSTAKFGSTWGPHCSYSLAPFTVPIPAWPHFLLKRYRLFPFILTGPKKHSKGSHILTVLSSDRGLFWHKTSICISHLSKFSKAFAAQETYQLGYFLLRFLSTTLETLALQKLFLIYTQPASLVFKFYFIYHWFTMFC